MQAVFGTAPLDPGTWLRIAGVAAVVFLVVSIDKHVALLRSRAHP